MIDSEQEISNILQGLHSKLDDIANESIGDHQLKRKLFIIKKYLNQNLIQNLIQKMILNMIQKMN